MKNKTGCKILDVVNEDHRIHEAYRDPDGFWLECEYGFRAEPNGPHGAVESTATALKRRIADIVPCGCAECVSHL